MPMIPGISDPDLKKAIKSAKKDKEQSHKMDLKFAHEGLGRAILRLLELKREKDTT